MRFLPILKAMLWLVLLGFAAMQALGYVRGHPEDVPWTPLDLAQPVGLFTGVKLVALGDDPGACHALLGEAGIRYAVLPARGAAGACGFDDAVRLTRGGARTIALAPADVTPSCPVAAGLALLEWHVIEPAAERHFGSSVTAVEHYGSYSCRRVNGRAEGTWSEHARANAIDIAAFRLADGRRISVLADWGGTPERAAFLREVRDGACDLFATVLSPDYNALHRDHLHLDQADRGRTGWRGCR